MSVLAEYQEEWVRIVEKAFANYNSLTPNERTWFNVQSLMGAVGNGGFESYYYNSPAERSEDCIEDLTNLGFPGVAEMLRQVNRLFPGGKPPADIDERNDIMDTWGDKEYDILDDLDRSFDNQEPDLEDALVHDVIQKMPFYEDYEGWEDEDDRAN